MYTYKYIEKKKYMKILVLEQGVTTLVNMIKLVLILN